MKPDPILEELWKVKDKLAAEAGYDTDRFLENLRRWEIDHPHSGPVVHSAEGLRKLLGEEERKRAAADGLVLKDNPPGHD